MKAILFISLGFISWHAFPQDKSVEKDSTDLSIITGKIVIANAGFAPVPSFSFNSPIAIGFLTIQKKRFSYEPDFALGLNGVPWMANNWFRYVIVDRSKNKFRAGINPSLFFRHEFASTGERMLHAQRNLTGEWLAVHKFSKVFNVRITYMHIHAFDKGALSGNFIDISSPITVVRMGRAHIIAINLKPQLFYFNFTGNVDGLFASATTSIEFQFLRMSVYSQDVFPLWSDFTGNRFKWNAGLTFAF